MPPPKDSTPSEDYAYFVALVLTLAALILVIRAIA